VLFRSTKELRSDFGKDKAQKIANMVLLESQLDISVKSDSEGWAKRLGGVQIGQRSVRISDKMPVVQMEGFEDGQWWVQDVAASLPARLLGDVAGKDILDLCAAPGGKTAQLISAGANLTALDVSAVRLARLEKNLNRLKLTAKLVEADILEWEAPQSYDGVLLDVPCSSTGTIRRHPDVMWTKTSADIDALADLQFKLLLKAKNFVKPGGILVFSNCSLLKREGENVLAKVLRDCDDLKLVKVRADEFPDFPGIINGQGAVRTLPLHLEKQPAKDGGMDGFFACRFEKC